MKRLLSIVLVLALMLGVLASCNLPFGGSKEADIQNAVKQLNDMYEDDNGTALSDGYELVAQCKYSSTVFTVTWTCDNPGVKIELVDGLYVVKLPDDSTGKSDVTLTATITSEGGQKATVSFTRVLTESFGMITNPVAGTAYKLALLHGNEGPAVVYFDGNNYNGYAWYFSYTTDVLAAVDVYLETVEGVEGGYRLYFMNGDAKTYIVAFPRDGDTTKGTLKFDTVVPDTYFTYSTEYNTLVYTSVSGQQFYMGSSGTYKSISCSDISYVTADTSYPVRLYGAGGVKEELKEQELPTIPDNYTSEDIVNALYQLKPGQKTEKTYVITGVVTSIKYAFDPTYNNVSVNIVVGNLTDKPVLLYRITGEGADTLKVGDTVTVRAAITNYNGTFETDAGGLIEKIVPGTGDNGGNGGNDDNGGNGGNTGDTNAAIVLDMMGSTNITSYSTTQMIYSANGITLTNDKNTSSTDCYNNTGSYSARFYGGATIKIEYPGMTKIVLTLDDYTPDGAKYYLSGLDNMTVAGATITRDNDVVTIVFDAATDVFQSKALASQTRIEKIDIYTDAVEGGNNGDNGNDNDNGDDNNGGTTTTYLVPEEDTAYMLYISLSSGNVYFDGSLDAEKGTYLNTTADAASAVSIFFEIVDGGYNIYFMNNGVKTYINAEAYLKSNGYAGCHFTLGTTATTTWTYDADYGILEVYGEISGKSDTFFAGTYGSYSTVSLSGAYYKDQIVSGTQYPARLILVEAA